MADERDDAVQAALAILRDRGFPVERIRVLPATASGRSGGGEAEGEDGPPPDRGALLSACLAIMADGGQHAAKDLARDLRAACGAGGTVRDGVIELQGDQCDKVRAVLAERGMKSR